MEEEKQNLGADSPMDGEQSSANVDKPDIQREANSNQFALEKHDTVAKDLTLNDLTPTGKELYKQLENANTKDVGMFGNDLIQDNTRTATSVLDKVQTRQTAEIGKSLMALTTTLKENQVGKQDGNFLMRLFHRAKLNASQMRVKYQKVGVTIDNIKDELDKKSQELLANNEDMNRMYDDKVKYLHDLNNYLEAGDLRLKDVENNKLPALQRQVANLTGQDKLDAEDKLQEMTNYHNRLSKKLGDLRTAQALAYQQKEQLNIIASANLKLCDTIHTSITTAIPVWYDQAANSLFLQSQKETNDINQALINATNTMLSENSKQMKDQAIAIVKSNENPIIKQETLQTTYDNIISAVKECQNIIADGDKQRKAYRKQIDQMQTNFEKQLSDAVKPNALFLGEREHKE